jgi:leucyl aminopeptidase
VLNLKSIDLKKDKINTLVVPVCEDKDIHDSQTISAIIKTTGGLKEFKGAKGDEIIFYNPDETKATRVIFLGLGKLDKIDAETLRAFAGNSVKKCIKKNLSDIVIAVPSSGKTGIDVSTVLQALMEGAYLGNHLFDKYKKEKKQKPLKKIEFMVKPAVAKRFNRLSGRITSLCEGTIIARQWVTTPPNDKRPEKFIKSITALAKKQNLKVSVLGEKELKQKNFNALLAVAQGSQSKPGLVVLEHNPKGPKKTVALVGKGVTFDSGGINLKSSGGLEDMKMDMSGAAAVAATLITASKLKLKTKIIGVIPIVENMPSGAAARPGDVVKSYDGKSVEIGNTDAEGRLILIDAISYAIKKYKPDTLIDMATLTGACVVALGEKIAGVFSSDDDLALSIVKSGEKTHERCWHMPLPDDYKKLIKSDIADIKNIGSSRWGGAITAALFLSEFVKDTPWAHIDIAGPAFTKKATDYCNSGGTGFGVRLLCELLEKMAD